LKQKVLFVASISKHILRFHLPYLEWFQQKGYETHVACRGEDNIPFVDKKWEVPFVRTPYSLNHFIAFKELKKIINNEQFVLIHCHTPMASVLTRLSATKARKKGTIVLYTAHGFHFFKKGPIFNWLTFYPIELILSRYCDGIITINNEDYQNIKKAENNRTRIFKVPGVGVKSNMFFPVTNEEKLYIRMKNGYHNDDLILIYAAEFISRKNHEFIIENTKVLINKIPNIKILFAGRGKLFDKLKKETFKLKLNSYIHFLGFRNDIDEIYKMSDIGISPSLQEGLPINVVEMMMTGLPIIASNIRGHNDLIKNNVHGFLYQKNNKKEFIDYTYRLSIDSQQRKLFSKNCIIKSKEFDLSNSMKEIINIYRHYLNNKI